MAMAMLGKWGIKTGCDGREKKMYGKRWSAEYEEEEKKNWEGEGGRGICSPSA